MLLLSLFEHQNYAIKKRVSVLNQELKTIVPFNLVHGLKCIKRAYSPKWFHDFYAQQNICKQLLFSLLRFSCIIHFKLVILLCFCTAQLSDTDRPVFLITVLISHQFSNAFLSLHELKELVNDNENFVIIKDYYLLYWRIHWSQKDQIGFPNVKGIICTPKLCNGKYRSVFSIKS